MSTNWIDRYNQNQTDGKNAGSEMDEFDLFMEQSELNEDKSCEEAWLKLKAKIQRRTNNASLYLRIAASLLIALGSVFGVYTLINSNKAEVIAVSHSKSKQVKLLDGSIVTLAPNSKISYLSDFTKVRKVELKGEGFFEVTKSEIPFVVEHEYGKIQVLGTSFNVKGEKRLDLYVNSGIVQVTTKKESQKVTKGQRATASSNGKINVSTLDGTNVMSWRTGHFKFDNQELSEIIPLLEKHYKVDITASKALKNCKVTAEFESLEILEVVNIISKILNAQGSIEGDKIKFSGRGCN